jgi:hypothetical protein
MDIDVLTPIVEADFYSDDFLKLIEDHLTELRKDPRTVIRQISNVQCVKYQGDFFGLLLDLQIQPQYHHAVLRVNNLLSAADFTGLVNQIVIPNLPAIDMLKNLYQTGKTS